MKNLLLVLILTSAAAAPGEEKPAPGAPTSEDRAATVASQLEKAIVAYYREYRRFPEIDGSEPGEDTVTDSGAELMGILLGKDKKRNPRQVEFFSLKNPKSLDDSGNLLDPWGKRYRVFIDSDYNNQITVGGKIWLSMVHVQRPGPDSGR